jgi:hypothetical protein
MKVRHCPSVKKSPDRARSGNRNGKGDGKIAGETAAAARNEQEATAGAPLHATAMGESTEEKENTELHDRFSASSYRELLSAR